MRRERRIRRSLGLDFLTARHLERDVMKRFDRFGFGVQLLDHLAIVGRLAERFAVVIDNGQNLCIERLLEFLDA